MKKHAAILLCLVACTPSTPGDPPMSVEASKAPPVAYNRSEWGRWKDDDRDCQDTRQEVLIAESLEPVVLDARGCKVLSGRWECPYTGVTVTDPKLLDIDHVIPLKEASFSGASDWSVEAKRAYFNNLENPSHLLATHRSANRSKGSKDASRWLPPQESKRCPYLKTWVELKALWKLSQDEGERAVVAYMLKTCEDGKIPHLPQ